MPSYDKIKYGSDIQYHNEQVKQNKTLNPYYQSYTNLISSIILQAIKDDDQEWLNSRQCELYLDLLPFDLDVKG